MTTTLTGQQQAGIERIRQWYHDPAGPFFLSGYAGTGKTTMAREIPAMMSTVARREAAITQARQWAYTACSRASERITWARAGR